MANYVNMTYMSTEQKEKEILVSNESNTKHSLNYVGTFKRPEATAFQKKWVLCHVFVLAIMSIVCILMIGYNKPKFDRVFNLKSNALKSKVTTVADIAICFMVISVAFNIFLLLITTFRYRLPLDERLLIGNVLIPANIFYDFIKLYHNQQKDDPLVIPVFALILDFVVVIYIAYSIYLFYPCCLIYLCKCCDNNKYIPRIMIIIGVIFAVGAYVILMVILFKGETNFDLIKSFSKHTEQAFMVVICIIFLVLMFDMFFLESCRKKTISIIFCETKIDVERQVTPYQYMIQDTIEFNEMDDQNIL
eukprot:495869_1